MPVTKAIDHDRQIIEFGEQLDVLIKRYEAAGKKERDLIFAQMEAIQQAATIYPATGLKAAAIQLRLVIGCLDVDDETPHLERLLYSVLNAVESAAGVTRDQWGGEFYAPDYCNPFLT